VVKRLLGWVKMKLGMQVASALATLYYMGTQLPSPKRGRTPQFSAHVYCGQTAGWMKTPLGTEVDLGRGHIVLDGDTGTQYPRERGTAAPPLFSANVSCGHGRPSQLLLSSCCKAHDRDRQTDRPTDHATPPVAVGRAYTHYM